MTHVIAHRGASGYLPEHTREAKALAYGQGADYIEQDVVATRDGQLVVLHDIHLDYVTDVARRFPDRCRGDGHYYVIDFDLAELRQLALLERRRDDADAPLYPGRFPREALGFRIATLEEEIRLIRGLDHSFGRRVGLYPEIKHPAWHRRHGIDLTRLLLEKLEEHGYTEGDDPVFVQCFDGEELLRARGELGTRLPLVLLSDDPAAEARLSSDAALTELTRQVQGLGCPYRALLTGESSPPAPSPLAARLRAAGLLLHPYTFRREGLPACVRSLEELLEIFIARVGVDAVFCDYPDVAVAVRDRIEGRGKPVT